MKPDFLEQIVEDLGQAAQPAPLRDSPERTQAPYMLNGTGFDDDGRPVPVVMPDGEGTERETEKDSIVAETRRETVRALLAFLALGEVNLKRIGWRTTVFTHLVFPNQSQAELARTLGVSKATVSQKLNDAKAELTAFLRAISRQGQKNSELGPIDG